jgi:hypothetical protein
MATRKAWAAVAEHRTDQGGVCAGGEELAGNPPIRDAPVGGRIALPDAQSMQTVPIPGRECVGIEIGG